MSVQFPNQSPLNLNQQIPPPASNSSAASSVAKKIISAPVAKNRSSSRNGSPHHLLPKPSKTEYVPLVDRRADAKAELKNMPIGSFIQYEYEGNNEVAYVKKDKSIGVSSFEKSQEGISTSIGTYRDVKSYVEQLVK